VIREGAVEALRACLELIAERDNPSRTQWYQKIFDEAQKVLFVHVTPPFYVIIDCGVCVSCYRQHCVVRYCFC